jgi:signal transduction histidine kinase/CheY-like chemotaxis protein/ligand-binding sensor domain-containing protein
MEFVTQLINWTMWKIMALLRHSFATFCALATALFPSAIWALNPKLAITQYTHDVWAASEGLPQNSVRSIVQTSDGYLWLATQKGLVRFDGAEFTVFNLANTPTLGDNHIICLTTDSRGTLWIGTGLGVVSHQGGHFTPLVTSIPLPSTTVRAIYVDTAGTLWIGTEAGVAKHRDGKTSLVLSGNRNEDHVHTLLEYPAGTMWAGTNGGLVKISGESHITYTKREGLPSNSVWALTAGAPGDLWIGTRPGGLTLLRDGRFTTYTPEDGLTQRSIIALSRDRAGNLWIGTDGGGLNRLSSGKFTSYQTTAGLSNQIVRCIYEDQEGSLWVGTAGGGLNQFKDNSFAVRSMREDLPSDLVRSIYQDAAGDVWLGTGNGAAKISHGQTTLYTTKNGLSSDLTWPVFRDRGGNLWAGSEEGILRFFRGADLNSRGAGQTWQLQGSVRIIYQQRNGAIWVCTTDELLEISPGRKILFRVKNDHGSDWIRSITQRADGSMWFGGDAGVQRFNEGELVPALPATLHLRGKHITALHETADGSLWIVIANAGLYRISRNKVSILTTAQGLPDLDMYEMIEDDSHHFWITSRSGLLRVAHQELDQVADGRIKRATVEVFGEAQGIQGNGDFAWGYYPSASKMRDGTIWFPTYGGALIVDPARLRTNLLPPPVYIESVSADGQANITNGARLKSGANMALHYTGLSFLSPHNVLFRYRLEGFDREWVDAANRRVAYYTNLPSGSYRFQVKACNNDGVWNQTGASFSFIVAPRFYQTGWFYLLCGLAIAAASFGAHYWRVGGLRRRERELSVRVEDRTTALRMEVEERKRAEEAAEAATRAKSQFLANMSHEIRTPMNGIMGMTELALDTNLTGEQRDYLSTVKSSADSLLTVLNDILDFSKIEAGKLELAPVYFSLRDCVGDVLQSLEVRAVQKNLELAYRVAPDAPDALLGDPGRLRQILMNLAGNALKFTGEGEIRVEVGLESTEGGWVTLHFTVADTGIGIAAEKQQSIFEPFEQADVSTTRRYGGTGLGLAISTKLVGIMHGRMWLESPSPQRPQVGGGIGSAFHFTAGFGLGAVQSDEQAAPLKDLRVLIVEEDSTNRTVLVEMLRNLGMHVDTVQTGLAALAALESAKAAGAPFPLAILDSHIPDMDGLTLAERIGQQRDLWETHLIVLTSGGRRAQLGIDAHLMKPVKRSAILDAILRALGRPRTLESPEAAPLTQDSLGEKGNGLRILLAEDNAVNQKLAVRILEKRGHTVAVANDGHEALSKLNHERFDLVLMDVQMPNMDGFEATAAIRTNESNGALRTRIVAMTANSMTGDRERCLAAGMDGYLSKPINTTELYRLVDAIADEQFSSSGFNVKTEAIA